MSSPHAHLEDREGMLLLYLADELPADRRAEAERLLASDAGLRAEFERLRETYGWLEGALAAGDAAAAPAPSQQAVAVRRVGQAVRRWHAERLARPPADPRQRRGGDHSVLLALLHRQWVYPAAAAAVVLMAFLASWSSKPIPTGTVMEEVARRGVEPGDERYESPLPPPQQPGNDPYVQLLALGPGSGEQLDLNEAERQMSALTALPEDLSAGVIPDFSAE